MQKNKIYCVNSNTFNTTNNNESNKCNSFFNQNEKKGRNNLYNSFLDQTILKNLENNRAIAEDFSKSCTIHGFSAISKIYTQDDFNTNYLFFILKGVCNIYINDNFVAEIHAGECFGEFPILDTRLNYTVSIYAQKDCCIAKISENKLKEIANQHPDLWLNMAKMIARRLKERSEQTFSRKPNRPSKIFIGSSVEGLTIARKIQKELSAELNPVIWNQGPFDLLGKSYLECLEEVIDTFDFGVFIFTPDDTIFVRGENKKIARDNVIFELGMFIGRLSRTKAYLVYPQNSDIKILSDFEGINTATYNPNSVSLQASLGPACEQIRESINGYNQKMQLTITES